MSAAICNLWYCSKCCGISEDCRSYDVEVLKAIDTGLSSNTKQYAQQFYIGQQIEVLQNQLIITGLITKANDPINFRFQQLTIEE